jgi:hypothetical protein
MENLLGMLNSFLHTCFFAADLSVVPPPQQLLGFPPGIYGISFDLYYHPMVDRLPDGWGLRSTSEPVNNVHSSLLMCVLRWCI